MYLTRLRSAVAALLIVGLFRGGNLCMADDGDLRTDAKVSATSEGLALAEFEKVHKLIKPQPGESRWREVPWLTSLWEARQKAAAAGKPIVVFTGSGGAPLCQT